MNYELCKELKDAGFPQARVPRLYPIAMEIGEIRKPELTSEMVEEAGAYAPTLSELIEACGKPITLNVGVATTSATQPLSGEYANGPTLEEAVARLWLELNKNDRKSPTA
jgi:hypothetical protein